MRATGAWSLVGMLAACGPGNAPQDAAADAGLADASVPAADASVPDAAPPPDAGTADAGPEVVLAESVLVRDGVDSALPVERHEDWAAFLGAGSCGLINLATGKVLHTCPGAGSQWGGMESGPGLVSVLEELATTPAQTVTHILDLDAAQEVFQFQTSGNVSPWAMFSRDRRKLLFQVPTPAGDAGTSWYWTQETGQSIQVTSTPTVLMMAFFLPGDRRAVYFTQASAAQAVEAWSWDAASNQSTRLVSSACTWGGAPSSPDGRWVGVLSSPQGSCLGSDTELHLWDSQRDQHRVVATSGLAGFSPDSRYLAFYRYAADSYPNLQVMDLETGQLSAEVEIAEGPWAAVPDQAFAPDSRFLSFLADCPGDPVTGCRLQTMDLADFSIRGVDDHVRKTTGFSALTGGLVYVRTQDVDPALGQLKAWSPGQTQPRLLAPQGRLLTSFTDGAFVALFVVEADPTVATFDGITGTFRTQALPEGAVPITLADQGRWVVGFRPVPQDPTGTRGDAWKWQTTTGTLDVFAHSVPAPVPGWDWPARWDSARRRAVWPTNISNPPGAGPSVDIWADDITTAAPAVQVLPALPAWLPELSAQHLFYVRDGALWDVPRLEP